MSQYTIIWEDENYLCLEKPTSLLSVPGRGPEKQDSLSFRVQKDLPSAQVVHRLDRDTSGLMLMAKGLDSQREMNRLFENRKVKKRYEALVAGKLFGSQGTISIPLRKCLERPPRHRVDTLQGRHATTHWVTLDSDPSISRVSLFPITGRSHQLRIHLQFKGHPILGDDLYAPEDVLQMYDRLTLHACYLSFQHPFTKKTVELNSECPF